MNTGKCLTLIFMVAIISSCNKDEENGIVGSDYLIFGHFYGECIGEGCVETFKLTGQKLFEDANDNYSGAEPFHFTELGNDKFEKVKDLVDFFPSALLDESEKVFGCPDCADQGGLFIQYAKNGILKSWRIDQSKSQVPDYLHPFMDMVNEKIALINN